MKSKTSLHLLQSVIFVGLAAAASGVASADNQAHLARTNTVCQTVQEEQITIICKYSAAPDAHRDKPKQWRIVLNRFAVSFNANGESVMRVELTFTNEDSEPILEARTVHLAIDDDTNHNYLRRELPRVDLRTLAPGKSVTYSDWLLAGSFAPGHYTFHLWIPSPDSSLKFNFTDNLLLSSEGVPNPSNGLNTLAEFTVRR